MRIPAGAKLYIGPPANPIPKQVSDAIGMELGKIPEIQEAHLPMFYIKEHIDPPAQVLFIVLEENVPSQELRITEALRAILPPNFLLNTTEAYPGDRNLPTVRATGTQLNLNREQR